MLLSWRDQYIILSTILINHKSSDFLNSHNTINSLLTIVVSLARAQNGLVMMSESDQVHPVSLAIVSVDLLPSLKIIERNRVIFAPGHQILPIMRNVNRVHFLLLYKNRNYIEN
jgi:hypothetical protein